MYPCLVKKSRITRDASGVNSSFRRLFLTCSGIKKFGREGEKKVRFNLKTLKSLERERKRKGERGGGRHFKNHFNQRRTTYLINGIQQKFGDFSIFGNWGPMGWKC